MSLLRRAALLPDGELDDEGLGLLLDAAVDFRRGGGGLRLLDWCELDAEERAALIEAADELRGEVASLMGWAAQSPLQAAQVAAPWDGGAAVVDVVFAEMRQRLTAGDGASRKAAG